ncbi:SOS response-associated peptidase [Cohaesibacter marisflavi]|uniref:SOS response-associated peptidase n=1 Tax=Cohaesibacter marisflavi TaxID=655353 RepID=UPI0029C7B1F4|nr:SOS response-associated peptidase [Cohaesibacter marisflavi]
MTGRLHLVAEEIELIKFFGVAELLPGLHKMPPRHNVAPSTPVLTITHEYGKRTARLMKWTFVPDWVKDPRDFTQISTARMETVEKKPSFKNAIRYRRCLVPVTGFYEWQRQKESGEGIPHFFRRDNEGLFALAGIWETWMGPNGEEFDGLALLTAPAKQPFRTISERLPLIIPPDDHDTWLNTRSGRFNEARPLLRSAPPDDLMAYPVSNRVNNPNIDDASLVEPLKTPEGNAEQVISAHDSIKVSKAKASKAEEGQKNPKGQPEEDAQLDLF